MPIVASELPEWPCDGCTKCDLQNGWKVNGQQQGGYTLPSGRYDAPLLVIGEAPGKEEAFAGGWSKEGLPVPGRPFIGGTGRLLKSMLKRAGLDGQYRILNTIQCRPVNNENPTPHQQECCSRIMEEGLEHWSGQVVLTVGRIATNRILGLDLTTDLVKSRSTWDGYVFEWGDIGAFVFDKGPMDSTEPQVAFGDIRPEALVGSEKRWDGETVLKSGKNKGKPKLQKVDVRLPVPKPPNAKYVVGCLHPSYVSRAERQNESQLAAALWVVSRLLKAPDDIYRGPADIAQTLDQWTGSA